MIHLVGCSNEAPVLIDRQETIALIDSSAHVSSVSSQFCKELALEIPPLGQSLELEGTGGSAIPYLGFVEVNLQIPGIQCYNEDVLLVVIPTTTYSKMVLVMLGSKIIDRALSLKTKGSSRRWPQHGDRLTLELSCSGSLQLSHTNSSKTGVEKEVNHSSPESEPMEVQKFHLDDIRGPVHTTKKVTILLFSTVSVHANTSARGHCMLVHVLMEPIPGPQLPAAVVLMATYGELHPGSSRVPICLCNLSVK